MTDGMTEKWGQAVADRGFAQVPNYLLILNQFLDDEAKLTPIELLALIQLVGAWWKKDELPFPSMRTMALRIGASERQLHRAITRLEKLGFLKRAKRKHRGIIASNAYDLGPLVEQLTEVAKAFPNQFPRGAPRRKALGSPDTEAAVAQTISSASRGVALKSIEAPPKNVSFSKAVALRPRSPTLRRPPRVGKPSEPE